MTTSATLDAADVEHLARLAGFDIDPAYRAGVAEHLTVMLGHRLLLGEPLLPALVEPAEVFRL